jgi:hypothetical protein
LGSSFSSLRSDAVARRRSRLRVGEEEARGAREEEAGASSGARSGRRRHSSEHGAGGRSAEQTRSKWWLPLGILSGGRVRECMGQLMGWQKMGLTAHVMFFFVFFFIFSFLGLVLLDLFLYFSIFTY